MNNKSGVIPPWYRLPPRLWMDCVLCWVGELTDGSKWYRWVFWAKIERTESGVTSWPRRWVEILLEHLPEGKYGPFTVEDA